MTASPEQSLVRRAALRLGVHAAALVAAIVVLLSAAAVAVVLGSQETAAVTLLDSAVVRADDVGDPPAGVWLAQLRPDGALAVTTGAPAGFPDEAVMAGVGGSGVRESGIAEIDGVEYRTDTVLHRDGIVVQGVLDLTVNHTERDRLVRALLGAGGAGLLLAAVAGTWLGRRALRPLSAAITLQRRFVADAGHELRTPVTLLNTRAQLLRRRVRAGAAPAEALADLDRIVADSARLGEVLEDLLIASDPASARPRERVDLTALARDALAGAEEDAEAAGVRLTGPLPGEAAHCTDGSPVALRRAISALLDNAVRHAAHQVTVAVAARGSEVVVDVADDGPGIDPELEPRLFERFATGRPVPGERRRRYGLGLALVSEIAAAHGGSVELLHGAGPGAALRLRLPASAAARHP